MGWDAPLPKTKEELDASAQAKREEIIAEYVKQLSDLQIVINQAKT